MCSGAERSVWRASLALGPDLWYLPFVFSVSLRTCTAGGGKRTYPSEGRGHIYRTKRKTES